MAKTELTDEQKAALDALRHEVRKLVQDLMVQVLKDNESPEKNGSVPAMLSCELMRGAAELAVRLEIGPGSFAKKAVDTVLDANARLVMSELKETLEEAATQAALAGLPIEGQPN